jgi:hypothetical protein
MSNSSAVVSGAGRDSAVVGRAGRDSAVVGRAGRDSAVIGEVRRGGHRARDTGPTGLGRRARRLSDAETEQRMLQAALAMVHNSGLTVSLDHISFEDVIRDADVSRSSAYRRWPYKDLFFSDLVTELARDASPAGIVDEEIALIKRVLTEHPDWLETPDLRQRLVAELFRRLAMLDFEALRGSARWRTYLALQATFMSLTDGELRDQVRAALAESERGHIASVARAWQYLMQLLGYRLRPELGSSFETLARLLDAEMRGLVMMALADPGVASHRTEASPFGADGVREWALPALGLAALASAFVEPDPEAHWDERRAASAREALGSLTLPDQQPAPLPDWSAGAGLGS